MTPRSLALALSLVLLSPSAVAQEEAPDIEELEQQLRDLEDKTDFLGYRSRAVKQLAALGTEEAWELVLGALTDIAPRVGDEAQLQLGGVTDVEHVEDLLLGKDGLRSKDVLVRVRVAEALGRVPAPFEAGGLVKALGDKDPRVRRAVCWTVERRAADGREYTEDADRLQSTLSKMQGRDDDPLVRGAALVALEALSPGGRARGGMLSDDWALRAAAAPLAAALPDGSAFLAPYAADEDRRVRTAVAGALFATGDAVAARTLAARVGAEPELRLRWRLVDHLQRLSGLKHRLDARPWEAWAAGLADDWRAAPPEEDDAASELGDRSVAFAGLPILSGRVCFLVDFSGSLWEAREDGKTRKQVVDVELRRALEALPEDTLFNVIPYTDEPHPWEDGLVPATARNVKKALEAFEGANHRGKGNVFDAIQLALTDPEVDTIVVLSDGAPSGGHRWNVKLMVDLLEEQNRCTRVAFDHVLVDAPRHLERAWQDLARRSGGRTVSLDL